MNIVIKEIIFLGQKIKVRDQKFQWINQDGVEYTASSQEEIDKLGFREFDVDPLPSRFQIGEFVKIDFPHQFMINKARVIKIHFSVSKVLYDLEVEFDYKEGVKTSTRIYNVDSLLLELYEDSTEVLF